MRDIEKHKMQKHNWWLKNKQLTYERAKISRLTRNRNTIDYIRKIKDIPCMDCGKKYPHYVMEFDHRERHTKEFTIASMVYNYSLDTIKKEVEKCDIVCANCHRERTWGNSSTG